LIEKKFLDFDMLFEFKSRSPKHEDGLLSHESKKTRTMDIGRRALSVTRTSLERARLWMNIVTFHDRGYRTLMLYASVDLIKQPVTEKTLCHSTKFHYLR